MRGRSRQPSTTSVSIETVMTEGPTRGRNSVDYIEPTDVVVGGWGMESGGLGPCIQGVEERRVQHTRKPSTSPSDAARCRLMGESLTGSVLSFDDSVKER